MMTHAHDLKTDPQPFAEVLAGVKTHEVRAEDGRTFHVGDVLRLHETQHTGEQMRAGAPLVYTGRQLRRVISHIQRGYGLPPGLCVLSFEHKKHSARGARKPAP